MSGNAHQKENLPMYKPVTAIEVLVWGQTVGLDPRVNYYAFEYDPTFNGAWRIAGLRSDRIRLLPYGASGGSYDVVKPLASGEWPGAFHDIAF